MNEHKISDHLCVCVCVRMCVFVDKICSLSLRNIVLSKSRTWEHHNSLELQRKKILEIILLLAIIYLINVCNKNNIKYNKTKHKKKHTLR